LQFFIFKYTSDIFTFASALIINLANLPKNGEI
jgi:hypothetical protein